MQEAEGIDLGVGGRLGTGPAVAGGGLGAAEGLRSGGGPGEDAPPPAPPPPPRTVSVGVVSTAARKTTKNSQVCIAGTNVISSLHAVVGNSLLLFNLLEQSRNKNYAVDTVFNEI